MNTTETQILRDGEISNEIQRIIREANKQVVIVSPYNKFWTHLKNEITQATSRNIRVDFVCRKDQLEASKESIDWLLNLGQGVNVYAVERLHSKIYFNETDALITSMNLFESSVTNSKEIAVLIRDEALIKDIREYANELTKLGEPQTAKKRATSAKPKTIKAYCVRCAQSIDLNAEKPLCDRCYKKWNRYKDPDYQEKYCHGCGNERNTTYAKPFCRPCYKRLF